MNLVSVAGRFAVCRFPPTAALPSWVSDCREFFSVTRTNDELSIVCLESRVPSNTQQCEQPWACLKVQGPLDFALTGILSALAQPLAAAGISIFVVSTFDTDYLLVKEHKLQDAATVLTAEGHNVKLE